ncbi:N-acetyltransferase [Microlunatus endophyticus]|uniref:N-acetyltransferase n=1 Tax=Microlunatus endophyticus TaxID=1716077 RepID=A0A917W6P1_9ACTN|nr:N-acetyltransferase [Microlunatus endophyticus]GGL76596.1 N-acetyltransferase [Microlunatus endophyticus]
MPDLTIRMETPFDYSAIAVVTRLAFGGRQIEVDMIEAIRHSDEYVPGLAFVAEVSDEIVGHCMLGRKRLAGKPAPPVLELGPLSVHPSWQRQGIGSRLVFAALEVARQRGREDLVVLLGEPMYYPRFGFRPATEFGISPDWSAAMVFPLVDDVSTYDGTEIPH